MGKVVYELPRGYQKQSWKIFNSSLLNGTLITFMTSTLDTAITNFPLIIIIMTDDASDFQKSLILITF